jgi:hypothetical protein
MQFTVARSSNGLRFVLSHANNSGEICIADYLLTLSSGRALMAILETDHGGIPDF